jgi:hypothetical protein
MISEDMLEFESLAATTYTVVPSEDLRHVPIGAPVLIAAWVYPTDRGEPILGILSVEELNDDDEDLCPVDSRG